MRSLYAWFSAIADVHPMSSDRNTPELQAVRYNTLRLRFKVWLLGGIVLMQGYITHNRKVARTEKMGRGSRKKVQYWVWTHDMKKPSALTMQFVYKKINFTAWSSHTSSLSVKSSGRNLCKTNRKVLRIQVYTVLASKQLKVQYDVPHFCTSYHL